MSPFKSCMCTKANTSPKSVLSLIDQSVSNQDHRIFLEASGLEIFCRLQWSAKSRVLPLFHGDVGNLSSVDDPRTAGQSSVRRHETPTASSCGIPYRGRGSNQECINWWPSWNRQSLKPPVWQWKTRVDGWKGCPSLSSASPNPDQVWGFRRVAAATAQSHQCSWLQRLHWGGNGLLNDWSLKSLQEWHQRVLRLEGLSNFIPKSSWIHVCDMFICIFIVWYLDIWYLYTNLCNIISKNSHDSRCRWCHCRRLHGSLMCRDMLDSYKHVVPRYAHDTSYKNWYWYESWAKGPWKGFPLRTPLGMQLTVSAKVFFWNGERHFLSG